MIWTDAYIECEIVKNQYKKRVESNITLNLYDKYCSQKQFGEVPLLKLACQYLRYFFQRQRHRQKVKLKNVHNHKPGKKIVQLMFIVEIKLA